MKGHGHYCKVCGEYKANEKFSGKGHAAHICKRCAALPMDERNQQVILTRMMNLPWRLSKAQIAWLKKHCHDKCPEVQAMAQEQYLARFPGTRKDSTNE